MGQIGVTSASKHLKSTIFNVRLTLFTADLMHILVVVGILHFQDIQSFNINKNLSPFVQQ